MDSTDIRVLISVLLPMVPAFVCFKFLRSRVLVKGPWKGWNLDLGGAFGGYFTVFIALFFYYPDPRPAQPPATAEVWEVQGYVDFDQPDRGEYRSVQILQDPPINKVANDGAFKITIARLPDVSGQPEFPDLVFEHSGFLMRRVRLEDVGEKDPARREINLNDPVVLQAKGEHRPYSPSEEPLQPLPE